MTGDWSERPLLPLGLGRPRADGKLATGSMLSGDPLSPLLGSSQYRGAVQVSQLAVADQHAAGDPDIADLLARRGKHDLRHRVIRGLGIGARQIDTTHVGPFSR